jgi:hypothetical protein
MKTALRKGGANALNIYTVGFASGAGAGLLGYATYPSTNPSDLVNDGIVMLYSTLPGGSTPDYNLGKQACHEVGHWLGLYNTASPSCTDAGDYVDDTPAERLGANYGCVQTDSCPTVAGLDPVNNIMHEGYDSCANEITPGQCARATSICQLYRPSS